MTLASGPRLSISRRALRLLLAVCALLAGVTPAWALTPESPEVQAALKKARAFLEKQGVNAGEEPGGNAIMAMALVKLGAPNTHPLVRATVDQIRRVARTAAWDEAYTGIYNTGISIIFLSSLNDTAYRNDIKSLADRLVRMQSSQGGFIRSGNEGGDLSMTQFAVLGMWEAKKSGAAIPIQTWQRTALFLLRSQTAKGGWEYRPGSAGQPTLSTTAAGVGSLYICRCHLLPPQRDRDDQRGAEGQDEVPAALRPVGEKQKERAAQRNQLGPISVDALNAGLDRGDDWMSQHFVADADEWPLYYLYAVERYQAFRELARNDFPDEPEWYTVGATHLIRTQLADGRWEGSRSGPVSTGFAVLFLTRSTRKSLSAQALAEGTLIGGRGIPEDLSNVTLRGGQVVVKPLAGPADALLDIMEDPNDPKFAQAVEGFGERIVQADESMLSPHLVRLKRLAGSESPQARAVAVRAQSRSRNLDSVPTLIYALGDADPDVVLAARDGLRLVSRKFDGFGLSETSIRQQEQAKLAKAIEQWRGWYRSVRPSAQFDE